MRAGSASVTAQRVAAQRLRFDRVPAPYGDAAADELLSRDVAGAVRGGRSRLTDYLAARTTFFDRVVVGGIDGGITQIVIAAAGYDGRALRYAKPGVRWFELDHPDTQRDKRARLDRLGIATGHISFVTADFIVDPIANALTAAGLDDARATLFLVEGVAVYLDRDVLERLLRELGSVAAPASRLAISLSVQTERGTAASARRAAFQSAVAAVGEPARTVLTADDADALFAATGWHAPRPDDERRHRARHAGLVIAARTG
jgi:methyltransferase (TIGR00027 family)